MKCWIAFPLALLIFLSLPVVASASSSHGHNKHPKPPSARHKSHEQHGKRVIVIDKSNQRLYAFDGKRLVLEAKCSTASHSKHWARGDRRMETPSTPSGTFRILRKNAYFWSRTYRVHMLDALFFAGGRAIHSTPPSEYRSLGRPASGGCVRLTHARARALFFWARKGDAVRVVHALPREFAFRVHRSPAASPLLHGKSG